MQSLTGSTGSLSRKTTSINQDIAALNAKKNSLEKGLTAQANALVKYYSQQSGSTESTNTSTSQSNGRTSLLDFLS